LNNLVNYELNISRAINGTEDDPLLNELSDELRGPLTAAWTMAVYLSSKASPVFLDDG
jgi:hypothetical protein